MRIKTRDYLRLMRRFQRDAKAHFGWDEDGWQRQWTFQQNGAPSHGSKETQRWLLGHFPDVITKQQWPAASPDLNPIELIWGILKTRVNPEAHPDVESLKQALKREWEALSFEDIKERKKSAKERVWGAGRAG